VWIHIEVDVKDGLIGSMDHVHGDKVWKQKVDYWNIMFRCFRCHEIRHVQAQCSKVSPSYSRNPKVWHKKKIEAGSKESLHDQGDVVIFELHAESKGLV
jgi:hypothetical protein